VSTTRNMLKVPKRVLAMPLGRKIEQEDQVVALQPKIKEIIGLDKRLVRVSRPHGPLPVVALCSTC
jgi:hypothetical protein